MGQIWYRVQNRGCYKFLNEIRVVYNSKSKLGDKIDFERKRGGITHLKAKYGWFIILSGI